MERSVDFDQKKTVFDRFFQLKELPHTARREHADKSPIHQEWEVFRALGKDMLFHGPVFGEQLWAKNKDFLPPEKVEEGWDSFTNEARAMADRLIAHLQIDPPSEIVLDEAMDDSYTDVDGRVARMSMAIVRGENGELKLVIYFRALLDTFSKYIGGEKANPLIGRLEWYNFVATLAHEFYHLYQYKKHPGYMSLQRRRATRYADKITEYSARAFSLQWLRKLQPTEESGDTLGLWLAKARFFLSPSEFPRFKKGQKQVQRFLGRGPTLFSSAQKIFTSEKQ